MRHSPEVQMTERLLHALIEGCREALPLEACGVLLGASDDAILTVSDAIFIPNAAPDPQASFAFEPSAWIAAAFAAKKSRRTVVGFFHSHPASPPLPSDRDLRGWDGFGCHLIIGFRPSDAVCAYKANDDGTWERLRLSLR